MVSDGTGGRAFRYVTHFGTFTASGLRVPKDRQLVVEQPH